MKRAYDYLEFIFSLISWFLNCKEIYLSVWDPIWTSAVALVCWFYFYFEASKLITMQFGSLIMQLFIFYSKVVMNIWTFKPILMILGIWLHVKSSDSKRDSNIAYCRSKWDRYCKSSKLTTLPFTRSKHFPQTTMVFQYACRG